MVCFVHYLMFLAGKPGVADYVRVKAVDNITSKLIKNHMATLIVCSYCYRQGG